MSIVGIIAEYNPFHNGHAYQIQKARQTFGQNTPIVCVMSGSFVQRGEPAITSKWVRTQAALICGADLVIEIPFTFACASAERFATGAVEILNHTGIVSDLYFGSECDDLSMLCCIAEEYDEENPIYISALRANLKQGQSFAKAREKAIFEFFNQSGRLDLAHAVAQILNMPNSILALEYLTALRRTNSTIKPSSLLRKGAGYLDCSTDTSFSSATGIRKALFEHIVDNQLDICSAASQLNGKMPDASLSLMLSEWQKGYHPVFPEHLIAEFLINLRSKTAEELENIAYMTDRLPLRLKNAISRLREPESNNLYESFRNHADTRRYAGTRISRALISMLVGHRAEDIDTIKKPEYLRILGFSDVGRNLLSQMRKKATLPIIDKASMFENPSATSAFKRIAELDIISSMLWNQHAGYRFDEEYGRVVIRLSKKQLRDRYIFLDY